jgi:putative ABC transport system ATP-binding protein
MIQLDNVSRIYDEKRRSVRALDGVSLDIAAGEFVAVRGPSGSGKTTLLLTMGAMIRPSEGRVFIAGHDVSTMTARDRARLRADTIGFVFQMFHLVPYLTALENVLVPTLAGNSFSRRDALDMLEALHLSDRIHHRPPELSTGERQRVALGRALLKKPAIILADEPTGNLDPTNAQHVMDTLADFHHRGGTVVAVTHDTLVDRFARRIVLIDRGRIHIDPVALPE